MKNEQFDDLLKSMHEMDRIVRGELAPGRVIRFTEPEEHGAWFRDQVRIGLDSANAGNLVSNEDVEAKFAARRAEARRKIDKLL